MTRNELIQEMSKTVKLCRDLDVEDLTLACHMIKVIENSGFKIVPELKVVKDE